MVLLRSLVKTLAVVVLVCLSVLVLVRTQMERVPTEAGTAPFLDKLLLLLTIVPSANDYSLFGSRDLLSVSMMLYLMECASVWFGVCETYDCLPPFHVLASLLLLNWNILPS